MSSCLLLEATYCQANPQPNLGAARKSLLKCLISTQELLLHPQVVEQALQFLIGMTTLNQLLLLASQLTINQCTVSTTASRISLGLAGVSGPPCDSDILIAGDADCYDAVTVVMSIVLVVMAIVMMGGAVYIGHYW